MTGRGTSGWPEAARPDLSRRAVLTAAALIGALPVSLIAACGQTEQDGSAGDAGTASEQPAAFSARFLLPGAGGVRLDFEKADRFSLSADAGPGSTIVADGDIYLYVAPSIASAGSARLLLLGRLAPDAAGADRTSANPALKPARLDNDRAEQWQVRAPLFEAVGPPRPDDGSGRRLIVARLPGLARAQYAAGARLSAGMNMSLCGDAVARLIVTWPAGIVGRGLAVLDDSAGIHLEGPIRPLAAAIALPRDIPVEDYRIGPA